MNGKDEQSESHQDHEESYDPQTFIKEGHRQSHQDSAGGQAEVEEHLRRGGLPQFLPEDGAFLVLLVIL